MKTTMSTLRRAAIAAIILFVIGSSSASAAATGKAAFDLNFIGNNETFPVFQLKVENGEEDELEIVIKDVRQEVLFNETVKGKAISRKYRLDVENDDLKNIRFVLTNKRTNETKVFQVINNTYVVDNVTVTRL
jgi:hypothetical protein